jgi:hypothetical protein
VTVVSALLLLAAACSNGDDNGGGGGLGDDDLPLSLTGAAAGPGGESGTLDITISEPGDGGDTLEVRGTFRNGSSSIPVSGTVDRNSGSTQFRGGGYDFRCHYRNGEVSGAYEGPAGTGGWAMMTDDSRSVEVQCGTFSGSDAGTMNIVQGSDGTLLAPYCANDGSPRGVLEGRGDESTVRMDDEQRQAEGDHGDPMSTGTWQSGSGSGTWTTDEDACP